MSEVLATSPRLPDEAPTVEGRLADIIETAEVRVDEYRLSDHDRALVVAALRVAVLNERYRNALLAIRASTVVMSKPHTIADDALATWRR